MARSRIVRLLAGLIVALCGLAIAACALAPIEGPAGPGVLTSGSGIATMPRYGTFVLASGFVIALAAIRAVWRGQRGWPLASLAAIASLASGLAVCTVEYSLPSHVAERTFTALQLRGSGPITIAAASFLAFILSLVLAASSRERDRVRHPGNPSASKMRRVSDDEAG